MSKKQIIISLAVFVVLLGSIPLFAYLKMLTLAKIVGVTLVVSTSVAIRFWTRNSKKSAVHPDRIILNRNDQFWLNVAVPNFKKLNNEDQTIFKDRMGLVLSSLPIGLADGQKPEREDGLLVAAHYAMTFLKEDFQLPIVEKILIEKPGITKGAPYLSFADLIIELEEWSVEKAKTTWAKFLGDPA